jgi:hypothetical protein
MPTARIRLEIDPQTSKRTIVIAYESDADALPHEHEEAHRALVRKLFEGGLAQDGDTIRVEREGEAAPAASEAEQEQAVRPGVKQGS